MANRLHPCPTSIRMLLSNCVDLAAQYKINSSTLPNDRPWCVPSKDRLCPSTSRYQTGLCAWLSDLSTGSNLHGRNVCLGRNHCLSKGFYFLDVSIYPAATVEEVISIIRVWLLLQCYNCLSNPATSSRSFHDINLVFAYVYSRFKFWYRDLWLVISSEEQQIPLQCSFCVLAADKCCFRVQFLRYGGRVQVPFSFQCLL